MAHQSGPSIDLSSEIRGICWDIDGDGKVEIVLPPCRQAVAFEYDGTFKRLSRPEGRFRSCYPVANLDGTGLLKSFLDPPFSMQTANFWAEAALDGAEASGEPLLLPQIWTKTANRVVVGNALYMTGQEIWFNGESDGYPAIGDLDGDKSPEIVVSSNSIVRVQDPTDGTVIWSRKLPGTNSGPPTLADFDGDGLPDIGVVSNNLYTVLLGDGTELWSQKIKDPSGF